MNDSTESGPTPGLHARTNYLKVRDDLSPREFIPAEAHGRFRLTSAEDEGWGDGATFGTKDLRARIEPWLTSLFQSEHLSLLAGSGLTHAVHYLATGKSATGMTAMPLSIHPARIKEFSARAARATGRQVGNLEDQLRIANELLRGLEILEDPLYSTLRQELENGLKTFAESILTTERSIAQSDLRTRESAFSTLVTFLMSFASRTGTRDRVSIFTTNYDRLIEAGAELAGLHLIDRFVGSLMPVFRSSRLDLDMHYNPPGMRGEPRYLEGVARFTKLHGSVDWVQAEEDIRRLGIPFGASEIQPFLRAPGLSGATPHELMIYPNSAKDRETASYPYVELFRDLASALCRPNSTLVTYGYSFGDDHINRVIRDMLTIPSTHLVVISYDDPLGRIMRFYARLGRPTQISLLVGPDLADLSTLTERFLPKAAIDRSTMRMGELLRHRFASQVVPNEHRGDGGQAGGDSL